MSAGEAAVRTSVLHLHRVACLGDKANSEVFTFVCLPQVVRGFVHQSWSRDFRYGGHSWAVCVERSEKHVGAYLHARDLSDKVRVKVDLCFTVLNRVHFLRNESFNEKQVMFTRERNSNGRRTFVAVQDLLQRNHAFDNYKLLLELELQNVQTFFEDTIALAPLRNTTEDQVQLESAYFAFAGFDWNVSLRISDKPALSLEFQRHTQLDHFCKLTAQATVKYNFIRALKIGNASSSVQHEEILPLQEQLISTQTQKLATQLFDNKQALLAHVNTVNVVANFMYANSVTEAQLYPTSSTKNVVRLYDTEMQEWAVDCDLLATYVKLRIYYIDLRNIPRQFTRCVRWNVTIVPNGSNQRLVKSLSGPFTNYYSERETDEGYTMTMDILVEDLLNGKGDYVAQDGALTVRIEWLSSHLLYNDTYTTFDNLNAIHKHQMRREILALQADNYSLEKQLFSYQLAIAKQTSMRMADADAPPLTHESSVSSALSASANHDHITTASTGLNNHNEVRRTSVDPAAQAAQQNRMRSRSRSPSPSPNPKAAGATHQDAPRSKAAASGSGAPPQAVRGTPPSSARRAANSGGNAEAAARSTPARSADGRPGLPERMKTQMKLTDRSKEPPKIATSHSGHFGSRTNDLDSTRGNSHLNGA